MWIIASLPLWFLGALFAVGGAAGVLKIIRMPGEATERHGRMLLIAIIMILSGAALLAIAAKVAS